MTRATKVLKEKAKDVPQSLLQIQSSSLIGPADKAAIQSFLAISELGLAELFGAPILEPIGFKVK